MWANAHTGELRGMKLATESIGVRKSAVRIAQKRDNLGGSGIRFSRKGAQTLKIIQDDMPALNGDDPFFLETGKNTTDGFFGNTQIVADVAARHAQVELGGRVVAHGKTPR